MRASGRGSRSQNVRRLKSCLLSEQGSGRVEILQVRLSDAANPGYCMQSSHRGHGTVIDFDNDEYSDGRNLKIVVGTLSSYPACTVTEIHPTLLRPRVSSPRPSHQTKKIAEVRVSGGLVAGMLWIDSGRLMW